MPFANNKKPSWKEGGKRKRTGGLNTSRCKGDGGGGMQPRGNQSSLRSQPTVTQPEERKGKGVNGRVSGLLLLGKNPFTRTQTPPTTAF